MLYSFNGNQPQELPFRLRMPDGTTRTDPSSFTAQEILDAGFVEAPAEPVYDPALQRIVWDRSIVNWVIVDYTQAELDQQAYDAFMNTFNTWKAGRQEAVEAIIVTHNLIDYQGDETSQTRMARAILALPDDITTIPWVALDNSENLLTKLDLQAILYDAGNQQSALWSVGRPEVPVA